VSAQTPNQIKQGNNTQHTYMLTYLVIGIRIRYRGISPPAPDPAPPGPCLVWHGAIFLIYIMKPPGLDTQS